jgi:type I restriction-modification system DNA methylase subunit
VTAPDVVLELVERFARNREQYLNPRYRETQVRREFLDPFFTALGWDVENRAGRAQQYKDVVHEDALKVGLDARAPDYSFRIGGVRKFFVEAKKPAINLKDDPEPAFQLRRYAWSAKLPLSVLSDFQELVVYDGRVKPSVTDKASVARVLYVPCEQYEQRWDEVAGVFSKEAIYQGSFDKYADSTKAKKGTAEVDKAFLGEIELWRDALARTIALRNPSLSQRELNYAVQATIDRIIFLRICEDRGIEAYGRLRGLVNGQNVYERLKQLFWEADQRYDSGLFHFAEEKGRAGYADRLTPSLSIDDKPLKDILKRLYYPESPYEFSVLPADILGQVYEQFLGKVIRLTAGHRAVVEDKPEVKKAGGVYYTPTYIVDYIVKNTVGRLLEGLTPKQAAELRVLDPACGSGSFLIGAYQYLLDWHRDWYVEHGPDKHRKELYQGPGGEWRLTSAEKKRILLNTIYGVDIDAQAVETTKLSLLLKVLEDESSESLDAQLSFLHERALPDLAANIKCGNSLIGPDFYDVAQLGLAGLDEEERYRINVFDWEAEFPDVLGKAVPEARRGFDAVIGNPPYRMLQPHNTDEATLVYFRAKYPQVAFKIDLFHLFLVASVALLKQGSRLGFIVPSTLLNNVYAQGVREHLADICCIHSISVARGRVFATADVHTCVVVLQREANRACRANNTVATTDGLGPAITTRGATFNRTLQSRFADLDGHVWNILVTEDNANLILRLLRDSARLGTLAKLNRGLISGDRAAYFSRECRSESDVPIVAGADVERYYLRAPSEWVLFERPETAGGCWDREVHFAPHKLALRQIGRRPTAAFVPEPLAVTGNIFTVMADGVMIELTLLGIINSRLMAYFWDVMFTDFKSSFPQFTLFSLARAPICLPDKPSEGERFATAVRGMMSLEVAKRASRTPEEDAKLQRAIEAQNSTIDRLVYQLYGLTDDEIALVEERVAPA